MLVDGTLKGSPYSFLLIFSNKEFHVFCNVPDLLILRFVLFVRFCFIHNVVPDVFFCFLCLVSCGFPSSFFPQSGRSAMLSFNVNCLNGTLLGVLMMWPKSLFFLCLWKSLNRFILLFTSGYAEADAVSYMYTLISVRSILIGVRGFSDLPESSKLKCV